MQYFAFLPDGHLLGVIRQVDDLDLRIEKGQADRPRFAEGLFRRGIEADGHGALGHPIRLDKNPSDHFFHPV